MAYLRPLFLLIPLLAGTTVAAAEPKSLVGVNTDFLTYYSPACPTIDVIKSSQKFGSVRNPGDGSCPQDADGWPKEDFGILLAADVPGLAGLYKFSCEGKAHVSGIWGSTVASNVKFDGKVTTADVEHRGGKAFAITCSGTEGGARNIKLLRPGYTSDDNVFTDAYLKSKEPFGAVRLMNWLQTNESTVVRWDQRCKPTDAQWTRKGVGGPYEPWLDYAAKYNRDLWLCIPHQADDDYIFQLATLCKERLGNAPVNLYLEDTNEYWNWQFPQAKWMDKQAQARASELKLNDPPIDLPNLRHRYHARRTVEIGKVFRDVFGPAAAGRIRPILTGHLANANAAEDGAKWIEKHYGPAKDHLYAISCAPYFGNYGDFAERIDMTPQQIADHLLETAKRYPTPASKTAEGARRFHAIAKQFGVRSVAYEGGPDLGQASHKIRDKALEAYIATRKESQLLPTTGQAVTEYMNWWFSSGGSEFFYFEDFSIYNRSGYWGLTNHPTKLDTPKFKAAAEVAKAHPAP